MKDDLNFSETLQLVCWAQLPKHPNLWTWFKVLGYICTRVAHALGKARSHKRPRPSVGPLALSLFSYGRYALFFYYRLQLGLLRFLCVKRSNSSYGLCIKCSNCCYVWPLPLVRVGGRVAGLIKISASADVGPRSHVCACLRILF